MIFKTLKRAGLVVIATAMAIAAATGPAQAGVGDDATLHIHKYYHVEQISADYTNDGTVSEVPQGAIPVDGVQFDIYALT